MSTKTYALIEYLIKHVDDRAMLATLRRGLGKSVGESIEIFPILMPVIGSNPSEEHMASAFQVASLFALHPVHTEKGNFGEHVKRLKQAGQEESSTERRFIQLLRLRRESIDAPLRQHVQILKSKDIPINWNQLFYDLQYWSHPDHFVQESWAKAFWG